MCCVGNEHFDRSKITKKGDKANFSIGAVLPQSMAGCLPWHLWECTRHLCLESGGGWGEKEKIPCGIESEVFEVNTLSIFVHTVHFFFFITAGRI